MSAFKQFKIAFTLAVLFAVAISSNNLLAQSGEELVITGPVANQESEAPKSKQAPVSDELNSPKTFSVLEFPIEAMPTTAADKSVQLKPQSKPEATQAPLKLEPPKTSVPTQGTNSFDSIFRDMVRPPENFGIAPGVVPRQFEESKKDDASTRQASKPSQEEPGQSDDSKAGNEKDEKLPKMKAPQSTNYKNEAEQARRGLFYRFRQTRIPTSPGPQNAGQQDDAGETLRIRVPADPDEQPFAYRSDTFQQEPARRIRFFRRR